MKFTYPAVFHRTQDGRYQGYFPDLEDCQVEAETLDDAIEKANEAANNWISVELEDEEGELPGASDPEDLKKEQGDVVRIISVNIRMFEGWDE